MRKRSFVIIIIVFLVLLGSGALFFLFLQRQRQNDFRNLVLITLDTVRADYLGCYGNASMVSPNLDRLARKAVVFDRAYTTAPFTSPSHASILTSQHPSAHGIVFNGHRKPERLKTESRTIATHLREAGYVTAAFVSTECLDKQYGFDQGFDVFKRIDQPYADDKGGWGEMISVFAMRWLLVNYRRPFFLWVHYFDPHLDYICSNEIYKELEIPRSVISRSELNKIRKSQQPPPPNIHDAYRAEVYEMDKYIGELLASLDKLNLRSSTIIASVADHGEYLGEHGLYDHHRLYEEVIRVPMTLSIPTMDKTVRRKDIVSTIDLVPTLLELLGADPMESAQGRDLLAPSASEKNVPAFSEWRDFRMLDKRTKPRLQDFLISVRYRQHKLIHSMVSESGNELFDLNNDPKEMKNLAVDHLELFAQLEQMLSLHRKNDLPSGLMGTEGIQISPESAEMLKSLGYMQ